MACTGPFTSGQDMASWLRRAVIAARNAGFLPCILRLLRFTKGSDEDLAGSAQNGKDASLFWKQLRGIYSVEGVMEEDEWRRNVEMPGTAVECGRDLVFTAHSKKLCSASGHISGIHRFVAWQGLHICGYIP